MTAISPARAFQTQGPHPAKIETVLPEFGAKALPVQPTHEQERLYRKQRLAASYRLFGR
ncbi:hypothetical protein PMI01_03664, partial [Caulobacter sp. AP07]